MDQSMTYDLPLQAGKISGASLNEIRRWRWTHGGAMPDKSALLDYQFGDFRFDFLWQPKPDSNRLFLIFSGDAMRKKNDPPVFQRWSWAPYFPGNCLFVSDPALYISEKIGLAWYSGVRRCDFLKVISVLVDEVIETLRIDVQNVYSYGSSGGGFAALRLACFSTNVKPIAINPQTQICQYEYRSVERYLQKCLNVQSRHDGELLFSERLNLCNHSSLLSERRIFYIQNVLDTHHVDVHYKPFCESMGVSTEHDLEHPTFKRYHFSHPDGHRKAETREVFIELMTQIEKGKF